MAAEVEKIADQGDVILVVGQEDVLKIRVHSWVMRVASKVFNVMFGSKFREGRDLSRDNPKEIRLEEDDAEAMRIICQVLHFKTQSIPEDLYPYRIWTIAKAIDKYFFNDALRYAASVWLRDNTASDFEGYSYILKASLLLRDSVTFKDVTKSLILDWSCSYFPMLDEDATIQLARVLGSLEEKRTLLKTSFNQDIYDTSIMRTPCDCSADFRKDFCSMIRNQRLEPEPISTMSLNQILKELRSNEPRSTDPEDWQDICRQLGKDNHFVPGKTWYSFHTRISEALDATGLDLHDFT